MPYPVPGQPYTAECAAEHGSLAIRCRMPVAGVWHSAGMPVRVSGATHLGDHKAWGMEGLDDYVVRWPNPSIAPRWHARFSVRVLEFRRDQCRSCCGSGIQVFEC